MDSIFSAEGLKFFVVVAIAAIVIFLRQRRQHRLAANPKVVKDELERLDDTVLSNVVVSAELGMNDVSHVVVSTYGVFV
ncbi:MAG: NERD domain-containing protein, partial [Nitrospina sp.]|nr:NERD domain-containing protein [Nitrospina sp.]